MKKIFITLTLLVCSTATFAQYIQSQGGVVSQGTLVNEKKEVVAARKGFDAWIGIGGGIGGYVLIDVTGADYSAAHYDVNGGYNITPRLFIGAGYKALYANTTLGAMYANIRIFGSAKANSIFADLRIGKVHTGTIAELNAIESPEDGNDYHYFRPQGLMGGYSMGYLWNHFALEFGLNIIGGKVYDTEGGKVINPYGLDWTDGERVEVNPGLDLFCKLSWRF